MRTRFADYYAASNKTFAISFPAAVVGAAALAYLSTSWFWMVPAGIAVIDAAAKTHEFLNRKQPG